MKQVKRVLFVCTGNTCRSPLAEAIARREAARRGWKGLEVGSAGVAAFQGLSASEGSRRAARRHGLDLSAHRSAGLTAEAVARADLVLAMSHSHLERIRELGGEGKVVLLSAFAAGAEPGEGEERGGVPDPFGGNDDAYEATYRVLAELVEGAVARLAPEPVR